MTIPQSGGRILTEAETNRATVARLMSILAGDATIESGVEFMAPGVVANVDGWRFQGINVWANWIRYIRTRERVEAPSLVLDELVVECDATVTARGRWSGVRHGRRATSKPGVARYRLVEGRIVEIWSTRRNYAFLCGAHVQYRAGFVAELVRVQRWKAREPQLDLTTAVRIPTGYSWPAMKGAALAAAEPSLPDRVATAV